jgi:hypothetical protein
MVVPLKPHHPPEGVDSRDKQEIDGEVWSISNFVDRREIQEKDDQELLEAKENTVKYWRKNEEDRFYQRPLPISNERKKIEVIRYYKKYRTPVQKSVDFQNIMDKVKEATIFEKENVIKKVKKSNPGMERYPEKINAIVYREMYNTYKDKYNEFIGNLPKEELKRRQMEKNKFKWNDKDLVNKITAINKFTNTGIFDDIPNNVPLDKETKEIKEIKETDKKDNNEVTNKPSDQSTKISLRHSQSENYSNSFLLPLVIRGNEINKEEERIAEKLEEEYKKEQKRQLLLESKHFVRRRLENKFESRYPLSQEEYNKSKIYTEKEEIQGTLRKNKTFISTSLISEDDIKTMNEISKSSECNPHFLEACNKIAEKEYEKMVKDNKKDKDLIYTYSHPGIYRTFNYVENISRIKRDINGEEIMEIYPQKKQESFWSCCMNSDKNSKGCQRTTTKKFKWNYY